jgi:hypothetical protein
MRTWQLLDIKRFLSRVTAIFVPFGEMPRLLVSAVAGVKFLDRIPVEKGLEILRSLRFPSNGLQINALTVSTRL